MGDVFMNENDNENNIFSIASLLLGIISILTFSNFYKISIPCSIVTIILSIISIKINKDLNYKKEFGIVAFILCFAFVISFLCFSTSIAISCLILAIAFGIISMKTSGYLIDNKRFLIASLVFLLISIIALKYPHISTPFFILAVTLCSIAIKKDEKGMATAGLVLGLIPLSIYVFSITSLMLLFMLSGD